MTSNLPSTRKRKLKVKAAEIAWNMHDLWLKNYELANPSLSDP